MRTTVRLPDDLLYQAKQVALAENRTLTDIIEEGVRRVVDGQKPGRRVLPPVSTAKGGFLVDISNNVALFDALDEGVPFEKLR